MRTSIEFFFDFNSTYSYLANARIGQVADEVGAQIVFRPMTVVGVMKIAGNPPTPMCPAKFNYNWADAQRWAAAYGVALSENKHFRSIDTQPLGAMSIGAEKLGLGQVVRNAFFDGFWVEGQDMGDPSVVRMILEKREIDPDPILYAADDEEVKDELRENTAEAAARGAFGAPTFFLGESMFFGNDRLEFLREAALELEGVGRGNG